MDQAQAESKFLEMGPEDSQNAENTRRMAQRPFENGDLRNVGQELAASSWVWRTVRQFHWLCLAFGFAVAIIIIIAFVAKCKTSYDGKFLSEQCPSEWIGYKKKCYFISEEEKNWTSSQTFCAKNESLLAIFENQEEMHSLLKHLKIHDSWIGLRKKGETFYWENGVALEADLFQIRNHSDCAYLDAFTISTSACSLPRRWICIQLP